jgi:hypothetical protein
MILAPMFRKRTETSDESNTTDESRKVAGFRAVYVWDEHQTSGKELPQIGSVTGDPSFYLERLEEFVQARGIRLDYSADIAPARGMAEKGKITLLPDQTPAETFATLVHELAHSDKNPVVVAICRCIHDSPPELNICSQSEQNTSSRS